MRIAVLTPAVPERADMLAECVAAVRGQTFPPVAQLIEIDHERAGCATVLNRLLPAAQAANADWIALVADDDLFYPRHLERLAAASADADVVYSYCDVEGRDWNPNSPFDPQRLRLENYIPSTCLIRASLAAALGGWRVDAAHGFEDWDFWLRALDAGARFRCVPTVTWRYRFHGDNLSWRS